MPFVFSYPVTSPTITLNLRSVYARLVNPQPQVMQLVHIAQGGAAFVFTPGGAPLVNRALPIEILSLHEANVGSDTGWAAVNTFILTTLEGSSNPCRVTDPDGTSYIARYLRGLETMQEQQFERWSGVLLFRQEGPLMPRTLTAGVNKPSLLRPTAMTCSSRRQ